PTECRPGFGEPRPGRLEPAAARWRGARKRRAPAGRARAGANVSTLGSDCAQPPKPPSCELPVTMEPRNGDESMKLGMRARHLTCPGCLLAHVRASSHASVPVPTFVSLCRTLHTNVRTKGTLATL